MRGYDIIGDVHGCATRLEALLDDLGYRIGGLLGAYRRADRCAVFVGDLIDAGPDQLRVLEIVERMVDVGSAQVVMGNHEFNAICYATTDPATGEHLRPHTEKNRDQHREFLDQLDDAQRAHYIEWFKTLPLWLDLGRLRVVHACWHEPSRQVLAAALSSDGFSTVDQLVRASTENDAVYDAVEVLLKGPEISLVEHGQPAYRDHRGHPRDRARMRWWDPAATTLAEVAELGHGVTTEQRLPYPPLPAVNVGEKVRSYAYTDPVPVFYGHYWRRMPPTRGRDWGTYTACLDFSAVKGGPLMAYRWSGEPQIRVQHYVAGGH